MSTSKFDHLKPAAKVSIGLFVVLFIFSILLYQFRMYFLDAPFIVFQILKEDSLAIMVGRYGAAITQIFPFLGQKLGFSMGTILLLYSMSFNLFYLISGVILYKLQAYHWVIALAFYQIGFATDAFFWTNNEIHQGICYFSLAVGVYYYAQNISKKRVAFLNLIAGLLLFIAIITHPLIIPVVVFVLGFMFFMHELYFSKKQDIYIFILCIGLCILKYFFSISNWYDGGKIKELSGKSLSSWFSFMDMPAAKAFFPELIQHHWSALIVLIILIVLMIWKRKFLLLMWVLGFSILYWITTSLLIVEHTRFYTESQWMPSAIFLILPLLYFSKNFSKKTISSATFLVFAIWIFNMLGPFETFYNRYKWQIRILNKMESKGIQKLILTDVPKVTTDSLMMVWALPVESLITSMAEYNTPKTFLINQPERATNENKKFLSCFEEIGISQLNQNYFPLDSVTGYQVEKYGMF